MERDQRFGPAHSSAELMHHLLCKAHARKIQVHEIAVELDEFAELHNMLH